MPHNINIAIDGYSSCGKSTLARDLANRLHYIHIDSGAMYRAVTLYIIRNDIVLSDMDAIHRALQNIHIELVHNTTPAGPAYRILLNREDVTSEIRHQAVNHMVSPVSAVSAVRSHLVSIQRQMGISKGVVMDGRDIGTVVFPDAELKLFLTADPHTRAQRRRDELLLDGIDLPIEQIAESLAYRDHIDSTRADSPLRKADDAIVIDNTDLSRETQLDLAISLFNKIREPG